jgi:fructose/tagatose bisphosphate aldolase
LVFHGGSGSSEAEIQEAVSNGVVKMNVGKCMAGHIETIEARYLIIDADLRL